MRTAKDFIAKDLEPAIESGQFTWSAPSNIALVKYWGKKPGQLPANPSLSFTLDACKTVTQMSFLKRADDGTFDFDLRFEGAPKPDFKPKIEQFLERISEYVPYLKSYQLKIDTRNTFPHSSGIASSASGMAALAVNVMSLERLLHPEMTDDYFYRKASFLARLGSGSACRSIRGNVVVWGETASVAGSSDNYGVAFPAAIHANFNRYQDTILLVDKGEKKVSSSLGHDLMLGHPYAAQRFEQAHENLAKLNAVLQNGDVEAFIQIVESEALTLHAMMMTSMPYFMLMKPKTLEIINRVWKFRDDNKIPVCFTLDAGANVHLLYPENDKVEIMKFIERELVGFCENGHYLCDQMGFGAAEVLS